MNTRNGDLGATATDALQKTQGIVSVAQRGAQRRTSALGGRNATTYEPQAAQPSSTADEGVEPVLDVQSDAGRLRTRKDRRG